MLKKVPQRFFIIEGGLLSGFQTFVLEKPSFFSLFVWKQFAAIMQKITFSWRELAHKFVTVSSRAQPDNAPWRLSYQLFYWREF